MAREGKRVRTPPTNESEQLEDVPGIPWEEGLTQESIGAITMWALFQYRQIVVDGILESVMVDLALTNGSGWGKNKPIRTIPYKDSEGREIGFAVPLKSSDSRETQLKTKDKISKRQRFIIAAASGSTNLTSDYDVTFIVPDRPELEIELVLKFNLTFRELFGLEAGYMFDTNVYTSGFMPDDPDPDQIPGLHRFSPHFSDSVGPSVDNKVEFHQTQTALALVSLLQAHRPKGYNSRSSSTTSGSQQNTPLEKLTTKIYGASGEGEWKTRMKSDWDRIVDRAQKFHDETQVLATSKSGTLLLRRDQGEMAVL